MASKAQKITVPNERGRTGRQGEDLAADFLEKQGFTIIARNWRCRLGEIDLIVERDQRVRFVEVKTRRGTAFGYPEEAVSSTKRLRWARSIELWLQLHAPRVTAYQADVISILWKTAEPEIVWIENVELA